jgi:hypothetical protein
VNSITPKVTLFNKLLIRAKNKILMGNLTVAAGFSLRKLKLAATRL